ncbi:MAG: TonB-dependent receptor [Chitinophaga sp.]|uniref:TonB-dependent receptor n=1 Tax=Chitinophaga sp. TaxID=1869181 RepID=UPI0025C22D06|nr:TonB-dependent receptor [Chitinophaga sp.]MBV8251398.1 TonB-dependent receptor [Chitinophaga sp.]
MVNRGKPIRIRLWNFLFLLFPGLNAYGQSKTLKISVTDSQQQGVNANIIAGAATAVTDATGAAQLHLAPGQWRITISAVGYSSSTQHILLHSDTSISFILQKSIKQLKSITIEADRLLQLNQMSSHQLGIEEIKKLPPLLGEIDPLRSITLLPGIKNAGDAGGGIYVRGGGPDENLVLMDGIPVYNPSHLLGAFSIFNGDAVKNISVIKGGMPAEYGGRLSSVISVATREGNKDSLKLNGSLGLISSRLTVEGPISKGKSSFIISARHTYIDQIARWIAPDSMRNNGYYFYDVNAKMNFELNAANSISLTFYTGKDNFNYDKKESISRYRHFKANWGNTLAGATWKSQVSKKIQQDLSLFRNSFELGSSITYNTDGMMFSSGLSDYQVKNDWMYIPFNNFKLKAGWQGIWHQFQPGAGSTRAGQQEFISNIQKQYGREAAAYLSADWDITKQLNILGGLRVSYFDMVGPRKVVEYGKDGVPTGKVIKYGNGTRIAKYMYPEPRLAMRYLLNNETSIKFSYTRTVQYLHLATTSAATFPSDLWIPVSRLIKPGIADQLAAGFFKEFSKGYEFSAEAYYKKMDNVLEFMPGAKLFLNQNLESEMIFGTGKAYGLELLIKKKIGALTGWIGYTLSRTERTFEALNGGKPFPYRYDRVHDLSIVANYQLSKKWMFSGLFVFNTGNALTMPNGRFVYNLGYNFNNNSPVFTNIDRYGNINDYRMPAYHRLDLSCTFTPNPESTRRFKSNWVFSVYNVYNRSNPYFIYIDVDEKKQTLQGKQVILFPILPSVSWNFNF